MPPSVAAAHDRHAARHAECEPDACHRHGGSRASHNLSSAHEIHNLTRHWQRQLRDGLYYRLPAPCFVSLLPLLHITTKPGLLIYPDFISRESEEWLGRVRVADTGTVSKGAITGARDSARAAVLGTNYSQMFLLWPLCRTELVPTMLQMCCYIQHRPRRRQRFFLVGRKDRRQSSV